MHTIGNMTFTTDWHIDSFTDIAITGADGRQRIIHAITSAAPEVCFHICEWDALLSRYVAPPELAHAATPISGSRSGDTGYRVPGPKHADGQFLIRVRDDGTRVLQFRYTSREPNAPSGAPFLRTLVTLPIPV